MQSNTDNFKKEFLPLMKHIKPLQNLDCIEAIRKPTVACRLVRVFFWFLPKIENYNHNLSPKKGDMRYEFSI